MITSLDKRKCIQNLWHYYQNYVTANFVGNCIGAKVFSEMTEEEVNDPSLGFSFGAKKILKKILAEMKVQNLIIIIQ